MSRDEELAAREWLDAAREHVAAVALDQLAPRVRCFHGQRAVELSLKALLIRFGIRYPHTHAINDLIELLPVEPSEAVDLSRQLTAYAVQEMYPDTFTSLDENDAKEAAALAIAVVEWVASHVDS